MSFLQREINEFFWADLLGDKMYCETKATRIGSGGEWKLVLCTRTRMRTRKLYDFALSEGRGGPL